MAYVILINDDNTLSAPKKQRIVQDSNLVDTLWFLVNPTYNGYDMSKFTVSLEYLKPISKEYKTETLLLSDDMYEDHLKYTLPINTEFTDEYGSIELRLSFVYDDTDTHGNPIQRIRKTAPAIKVDIIPIYKSINIAPDNPINPDDSNSSNYIDNVVEF